MLGVAAMRRPDRRKGQPLQMAGPSPTTFTATNGTSIVLGRGVLIDLDLERERRRGGAWCPPWAAMWTWDEAERSLSRWPA
jgi:hypothetical protein